MSCLGLASGPRSHFQWWSLDNYCQRVPRQHTCRVNQQGRKYFKVSMLILNGSRLLWSSDSPRIALVANYTRAYLSVNKISGQYQNTCRECNVVELSTPSRITYEMHCLHNIHLLEVMPRWRKRQLQAGEIVCVKRVSGVGSGRSRFHKITACNL